MYSSDLAEAFVHAQQQELLERAASSRRARAVTTRSPAPAAPKWRRPHPLVAFHTWLAAGQL